VGRGPFVLLWTLDTAMRGADCHGSAGNELASVCTTQGVGEKDGIAQWRVGRRGAVYGVHEKH
jgi:hypothetical protein